MDKDIVNVPPRYYWPIPPKLLDLIKTDILKVIANYAEIEEDGLEIKMSKSRGDNNDMPVSALVANIPLKNIKERKM